MGSRAITLDSAKVALHAHGGDVPAQGSIAVLRLPALDFPIEVQPFGQCMVTEMYRVRSRENPSELI
jgi:hypothetical protein